MVDQTEFLHKLKSLFEFILAETMKIPDVKVKLDADDKNDYFSNLCQAVETYLIHNLHQPILSLLAIAFEQKNANFNRNIRYKNIK